MNNNPLVSVIIPCYNHEKYVSQTLDSIIEDEYPNKEIVIINDGSRDRSDDIIRKWIKDHDEQIFINYLNRQNKGLCATLNELIQNAKGEYLVILASDDMLYNNMIGKRVSCLIDNPSKKIVVGNAIIIDKDNNVLSENALAFHGGKNSDYKNKKTTLKTLLFGKWGYIGPVLLVKKDLYDDIGYYKEDLTFDDHYFYLRVLSNDFLIIVDEIVAKYRIHTESLSHDPRNSRKGNVSIIRSYLYAYKYFDLPSKLLLLEAITKKTIKLLYYDFIQWCKRILFSIINFPKCKWRKIKYTLCYKYFLKKRGQGCFVSSTILFTPQFIELGNNVFIGDNARIQGITCYEGIRFEPRIILGDNVSIQQNIHLTCAQQIIIGSNTAIAANVTITDIHHPYDDVTIPIERQELMVKSVSIGESCKIYNNAIILPGTKIGKHVTIGGNSVVNGNIPDYCVAVGSPARIVKRYNFKSNKWEKTNSLI